MKDYLEAEDSHSVWSAIIQELLHAFILLSPFSFSTVLFVKQGDQNCLLHLRWEFMIDFYSGMIIFTVTFFLLLF